MSKDQAPDRKELLVTDAKQIRLNNLAKHRNRAGKVGLAAAGGVGALLTMLYSVVFNFRNQLNVVPVPFNFIIFPALGVLGLVIGVLSIINAVMVRKQGIRGAEWRTALFDAIFNTGDGLGTAGIIIAGFIAPGIILPILPYVFIAIMGAQLIKKVSEMVVHLSKGPKSQSPADKSAHRHQTATQAASAMSFVLGIASVGLIMAAGIHILAPLGIIGGVFLVGFMGALYAKGKMAKKAAPAATPTIEQNNEEPREFAQMEYQPTPAPSQKGTKGTYAKLLGSSHSSDSATEAPNQSLSDLSSESGSASIETVEEPEAEAGRQAEADLSALNGGGIRFGKTG